MLGVWFYILCFRFCSMVKEMISDGTGNAVELEGEGDGDTLEVREGVLA